MILVGIPCNETIKTRTVFSLFNLQGDIILTMQMGADVAHNRNKLATLATEKGYSHLLFIDSDMEFQPDTLERMLKHNKDILGLAANHRKLPLESVVKPLDGDLSKSIPSHLFEAGSCGTGIMLVRTEVFKNLDYPYFEFKYMHNKELNDTRIGEDFYFCAKARKAGYSIWVDPTIPVRHIGDYAY